MINLLKMINQKKRAIFMYFLVNNNLIWYLKEVFESVAILIIIIGTVKAVILYTKSLFFKKESSTFYFNAFRVKLARSVSLALEVTIAGDVIATTGNATYQQLLLLVITILIRTFINYMLTRDINDSPKEIRNKIDAL